jgi:Protein of unknown function (DUF2510)
MTSAAPGVAGWYPDPVGRFDDRYWDGGSWTSAVKRRDQVESDPEAVPAKYAARENSASFTIPTPQSGGDPLNGQRGVPPEWPRGATGDRQISLPLADAQREVVRVLPLARIRVTDQQPGLVQATVPIEGETNLALAIFLCLACLIPGIIYAIASSRTRLRPAAVHLAPSSLRTTVITIQAAPAPRQAVLSALATLP